MLKSILKKLLPFHIRYYIRQLIFPASIDKSVSLKKMGYAKFIKKGDLVIDVGANMGNRVGIFLALGARVIAVEPQDNCVKYLKLRFGKRIVIIQKGLGAKEEVREFFQSPDHTISSFSSEWINSVRRSGRFAGSQWNNSIKMQITTLDNLIKEFGVPDFIKIDVEGFEPEVLKGLSYPVTALSFEYSTPEQNMQTLDCLRILSNIDPQIQCNYSIGETLQLELKEWISSEKMIEYVKNDDFQRTGFGDIYVLMKREINESKSNQGH